MIPVMAFCPTCDILFLANFPIRKEGMGTATIIFRDCLAGKSCPKCKGDALIVDSTYKATGNIIRGFINRESIDELKKLKITLEIARKDKEKQKEALEKIEKEHPNFWKLISKYKQDIYNISLITLALIALKTSSGGKKITNNHIKNYITNNYSVSAPEHINKKIPITEIKGKERNLPCPCGSGIKLKKCCGRMKRLADEALAWLDK